MSKNCFLRFLNSDSEVVDFWPEHMTSVVKDKSVFVSAQLEESLCFSVHCFLTQFIFRQNFICIGNS